MRRIARGLFRLAAAVSLLLCVAVCVLWVKGYRGSDQAFWYLDENVEGHPTRILSLYSGRGMVQWGSARLVYWNRVPGLVRIRSLWRPSHVSRRAPALPLNPGGKLGTLTHSFNALMFGAYGSVVTEPLPVTHTITMGGHMGPLATRTWTADAGSVPHWVLAVLTGALPAASLRGWARIRRRRRGGLCVSCGYDLGGSPGWCPECGTPPSPPSTWAVMVPGGFSGGGA